MDTSALDLPKSGALAVTGERANIAPISYVSAYI
jgi:hypothetical protein